MHRDNRIRALAEVVSLDAWHKGFTASRKAVDLHVDVVFTTGRIGDEQASNVRFKLHLKRADVVVVIPPTEPANVDKASVSRDAPQITVRATATQTEKRHMGGNAKLKAKADPGGIQPLLGAEATASRSRDMEKAIKISEDLQSMRVTQVQTSDGNYAWRIEPATEEVLKGRPWNALEKPRLKINDLRPDRTKGIEPNIRVELRCRREDLEITDIVLKDKAGLSSLAKAPFGRNKTVAAEALIRTRLFQAGLLTGEIDDPYAQMTLCAIIAETQ